MVVIGLVLLVVFGVAAAGQARDMKLAGAVQHRVKVFSGDVLGFLGFKEENKIAQPAAIAQPAVSQAPASDQSAAAQVPAKATMYSKSLPQTASDAANEAVNKQKSNATAVLKSNQLSKT